MKRLSQLVVTVIVALVAGACGSDSQLPVASGKGNVRMINAISSSPSIGFLIEERTIDGVEYKSNSGRVRWDDLEYTFNFEISRPSLGDPERIASRLLKVTRDIEYTFVLRGTLDSPAVDVWDIPEREFSGSETIFELRVGHAADALGDVDVYIDADGVAPVLGQQVATLSPGEVSSPADIETAEYVVTITAPGQPGDIVFQSEPTDFAASQSILITVFEGDENDTAPVNVRVFNELALNLPLADTRFPPTARFVHATPDLGTSDIYDDAALQNRIVANLAFGDITGDIAMSVGEIPITATAPGNIGAIQLEDLLTTTAGTRLNYYLTARSGELVGLQGSIDRRSIETVARMTFFHSAANHSFVDLYVVDAGTTIEEQLPRQVILPYGFQSPAIALNAGSYDIYLTVSGEKTVLDGPIRLDAALGDVVEAVLLDRVDPSLAEFKLFPPP